ncbi:MAG: SulP family inorganic anion transporter [Opitutales bacterium]
MDPFPLRKSLKGYSVSKAMADAKAAVNVALLDFPQGMAYALIAGLPVQIGIFCSALASLTGPMLASSRFVMLGPTNATAVMLLSTFLTLNYGMAESVAALPLLLILVGVFMTVGALLRVAGITQYVSRAVVAGYITAAAFLIIVNQLKNVLGLTEVPRAGTFVASAANLFEGLGGTDLNAVLTATITLGIYLPLRRFGSSLPTVALSLVGTGLAVQALGPLGLEPEFLDGFSLRETGWPLSLPVFDFNEFAELANAALAIAFLSLLESSSIAKTLAAQAGDRIDLNQQMLSMGAANLACAFGSGMAVSGSLTRSVLNFRSGAKTAVSSMFSGGMLVLGLLFLGDLIAYIPRPSLAVLVITVGISLINRGNIRTMVKSTREDALVFGATFFGGLVFALDTAIYLGAVASIVLFVRKAARPGLKEISFDDRGNVIESAADPKAHHHERPEIAILHVEGDLFFASCDVFLDQMRHLVEHPDLRIIILRLRNAHHLDASAALTIQELIKFARTRERDVLVSGAHEEVEEVFRKSGTMAVLGEENFFRSNRENPTVSTRDALKRAQQIMGTDKADITIYATEKQK